MPLPPGFQKPPFDALPIRKDGPRANAWGLFGPEDEIGMLNLLTPETTVAAAREITDGHRVSIDWRLNRMDTPCWGRERMEHRIESKSHHVNDDTVVFNTQVSSQWDGYRHFGFPDEKSWFGGHSLEDLHNSDVIGVHAWVNNGGIVGRGVLLDYVRWAEARGIEVNPFVTKAIPVSTLEEIAAEQKVELRQGDIVLIRVGWTRGFEEQTPEERAAHAAIPDPPGLGIESSETTLRWIWDKGFAAMGGDHPTLEAWPCQDRQHWLHVWLLAGWGMPIGELFDLEELSRQCEKRGRWSFFFSSMPLRVPGGVASPPNGVAIF